MNTFCPSVLVEKMCLSNLSLSFSSAAIISIDYTLRNNISSRREQGSFAYCVASDQNGFAMGKFCWTLTSFSIVKTHVRLPDVSQWIRTKKKKNTQTQKTVLFRYSALKIIIFCDFFLIESELQDCLHHLWQTVLHFSHSHGSDWSTWEELYLLKFSRINQSGL